MPGGSRDGGGPGRVGDGSRRCDQSALADRRYGGIGSRPGALPVKSLVLPSSKVPVAVICWVCPSMSEAEVGATASEVSVGFTKKPRQPAARAT